MAYDAAVLRRATEQLEEQRRTHEQQQEYLRMQIYQKQPRLAQIDRQLQRTMAQLMATALRRGESPTQAIASIRATNQELQREHAELLAQLGYDEKVLEDRPMCIHCGDTGWRGTHMCDCLKKLYIKEQIVELSKLLSLGEQTFETFRLDYYSTIPWPGRGISPRENMKLVLETCQLYATRFKDFFTHNLFLSGTPGLGKTFLSACIARSVSEQGYSVVYDTAGTIFAQFEAQKFQWDSQDGQEAKDEKRRYLQCDLLIVDDLGSELTTQFTQTALYELINTIWCPESIPLYPRT